ncbi:MAG: SBBP repeat-containing protein, partial [Pyrinomonadaceae bacterium]
YSKVEYEQVYKGIDLVYYGNQRQLEYDFKVAPKADPERIKMRFEGADKIELGSEGDLLLHTAAGEVRMRAPITYQEIAGVRRQIASRYALTKISNLKSENSDSYSVGFEVAEYDTTKPLVIDPVLVYSTYLGGSGEDDANSITVDAAGNAYVIGFTDSTNFSVTGAVQPAYGGNPQDVFVSKLNAAGTALVYSTYLGGSGQDNGSDIAVDAAGNAYITGYTGSTNFPMANAMQPTRTGFYNAFVAKLNPTGSQLVYSTYFGGTVGEFGSAIAVDSSGNAYVGGVTSSPDFPKLNPIQSAYGGSLADAFVAKFNPAGSQIVYSTYLGGNGNDGVTGIAIDPTGNAHVTGVTFSSNFPTANPLQANFRGGAFDAFVTKINPSGTSLIYSTYLGGTDEDRGFRVALDGGGNAYVAGMTLSQNFPIVSALQPTFGGGSDAFITKLNPAGAISYSTFLGGNGLDGATGLAVTSAGNAYVAGFTTSTNFPLANPLQPLNNGGAFDAFVTKLNMAGTALDYSTYLGGGGYDSGFDIAADSSGNAYVFGRTDSTNFPTRNPLQ